MKNIAHCLSFVKSNVEIHELLAGTPDPTGMYFDQYRHLPQVTHLRQRMIEVYSMPEVLLGSG